MSKIMHFLVFSLFSAECAESQTIKPEDIASQCTKIYVNAINKSKSVNQQSLVLNTLRTNACSASNRSFTAGFDQKTQSILNGIPAVGSYLFNVGITNNSSLCKAYDKNELDIKFLETFETEPVVEALEFANKCLDIANRSNLLITHSIDTPGKLSLNGRFTIADAKVDFTVSKPREFRCISPRRKNVTSKFLRPEEVDENYIVTRKGADFTVTCEREGVFDGQNKNYAEGVITFRFSGIGLYTVKIPSDSEYGVSTRRKFDGLLNVERSRGDSLNSDLIAIKALKSKIDARTVKAISWSFKFTPVGSGVFDLNTYYGILSDFNNIPQRLTAAQVNFLDIDQSRWLPGVTGAICPTGTIKSIEMIGKFQQDKISLPEWRYLGVCEVIPS